MFCFNFLLHSQDSVIQLGGDQGWDLLQNYHNITQQIGLHGYMDLYLSDNTSKNDMFTDLLLSEKGLIDTENYTLEGNKPNIIKNGIRGDWAFRFNGTESLQLIPNSKSIFKSFTGKKDFSIEFWINPFVIENRSTIIKWNGGILHDNIFTPQSLSINFQKRRLGIYFKNVFQYPDGTLASDINITGLTNLIPNKWSHHLIRYSESQGTIEYFLNNRLEAITYVTPTGKEKGPFGTPSFSDITNQPLIVGQNYTGLIDELRISQKYRDTNYSKYPKAGGSVTTKPIDLGYSNSLLLDIKISQNITEDSDLSYYYRITDHLEDLTTNNLQWLSLKPNELDGDLRGRYIQMKIMFHTNATLDKSPQLSTIQISYQEDLPPAPPLGLVAKPGNSSVKLNWKEVTESDIAGYYIYYGDSKGEYWGTEANEGDSPIDVGNITNFELSGLQNDKLYFFTVVAYDKANPPHESQFSIEVQARPERKYNE